MTKSSLTRRAFPGLDCTGAAVRYAHRDPGKKPGKPGSHDFFLRFGVPPEIVLVRVG
ncbi:MAG: hypothetical protein LBR29_06155 [Methylobacteriaceae bacterium]|jgi:hypothetical protein|nr:hypothetical protein [Methylobacteriaceae bacterium]